MYFSKLELIPEEKELIDWLIPETVSAHFLWRPSVLYIEIFQSLLLCKLYSFHFRIWVYGSRCKNGTTFAVNLITWQSHHITVTKFQYWYNLKKITVLLLHIICVMYICMGSEIDTDRFALKSSRLFKVWTRAG